MYKVGLKLKLKFVHVATYVLLSDESLTTYLPCDIIILYHHRIN